MRRFAVCLVLVAATAHADKSFNGGHGGSWDCGSDPVVVITTGSAKYTVKGSCKSITVTGGHNTLVIESAGTLDVTGASNTVSIDAVDAININGAGNHVTWKRGKSSPKPSVSQLGQNNSITQG
ncbi:MAG TPA: DUF3060 domain-containing protein [Kofleriaceae bacterium]|jgi:hypothetical protein